MPTIWADSSTAQGGGAVAMTRASLPMSLPSSRLANPSAALQQITTSGSFFGGVGSYPLEGGYLYFCPTGGSLTAYKFGLDGGGNPIFTQAGTGPSGSACIGNPTV